MGKRNGTCEYTLPGDVVELAAIRANAEKRSLTDVIVALLRDYAAGHSWVNLPDAGEPAEAERVNDGT